MNQDRIRLLARVEEPTAQQDLVRHQHMLHITNSNRLAGQ